MIVEPKIRGFICTTAHPTGCEQNVADQIAYVKSCGKYNGAKNALIIGSSTGYGLATRIAAAFGSNTKTIGVAFERPASGSRTATAGYYNTAAFQKFAKEENIYAKSIMGDAFSDEIKAKTIELIKKDLGKVDLVIYSLAAPRRTSPDGKTYSSVIKPIGNDYSSKTIDMRSHELATASIEKASEDEISNTIKVMGGEDWKLWIKALSENGVLADNSITLAYSYIGPNVTHAIYTDGTIGMAKKDLEKTAKDINNEYNNCKAYISVNKAVVTQASSAIPAVPLYTSILFKVMKEKGTHEGCIEQMRRMLQEKIYKNGVVTDNQSRLRLDDLELDEKIQKEVSEIWDKVTEDNFKDLTDLEGYYNDFNLLFGFDNKKVDYSKDVDINVEIENLV